MLLMGLFWLLVIAGVIYLVVVLARRAGSEPGRSAASDRAMEILRERLARGEIDEEEFERKKKMLE
jgi:putative membrane protein